MIWVINFWSHGSYTFRELIELGNEIYALCLCFMYFMFIMLFAPRPRLRGHLRLRLGRDLRVRVRLGLRVRLRVIVSRLLTLPVCLVSRLSSLRHIVPRGSRIELHISSSWSAQCCVPVRRVRLVFRSTRSSRLAHPTDAFNFIYPRTSYCKNFPKSAGYSNLFVDSSRLSSAIGKRLPTAATIAAITTGTLSLDIISVATHCSW